ncbi:hypothetical protein ABPG77_009201 [Micractinium sp. CCAP 211/92]
MSKLVAVCGATGKQGGGVVAALQRLGGFNVRALSRNPESASSKKLSDTGVQVVKADFEDTASLDAAFKDVDAVFGVTDFWQACRGDAAREKQQGINLVDAAKRQGVKHFVWSSLEDTRPILSSSREPLQGTYTVPHFDAKHEVEQYAKEQLGSVVTPLYPSVFMENLLPGSGMDPTKQADGSIALFIPVGQSVVSWCTTPDIGGVAAAVIQAGPAQWGGKTVGVAGEHATLQEVADTFTRVFGKKVVGIAPPVDDWIQAVQGFGVPEAMAKDLGNMFLFYDLVPMTTLRPLEQTLALNPGVQNLEAFLVANKDKYAELFA